jgi:hypothetical protein
LCRTKLLECSAGRIAVQIMEIIALCFREDEHHDLYTEIYQQVLDGLYVYESESRDLRRLSESISN